MELMSLNYEFDEKYKQFIINNIFYIQILS